MHHLGCAGLEEKRQDAEFAARLPGASGEALLGLVEGAVHLHMCALLAAHP